MILFLHLFNPKSCSLFFLIFVSSYTDFFSKIWLNITFNLVAKPQILHEAMYVCVFSYVYCSKIVSKLIVRMDQIIVLEYDMHNLLERHTNEGTKSTKFCRSYEDSNKETFGFT